MTSNDDLKEVEDRVRELAKLPPTLELLQEAVAAIAAARGKPVEARRAGKVLSATVSGRMSHLISLERDEFVDLFGLEHDEVRYSSLERMAWWVNGMPFLPRHVTAAANRLRLEGKDSTSLRMKDLMAEVEKEWPRPTAVSK